jgi:hypothetical protein
MYFQVSSSEHSCFEESKRAGSSTTSKHSSIAKLSTMLHQFGEKAVKPVDANNRFYSRSTSRGSKYKQRKPSFDKISSISIDSDCIDPFPDYKDTVDFMGNEEESNESLSSLNPFC